MKEIITILFYIAVALYSMYQATRCMNRIKHPDTRNQTNAIIWLGLAIAALIIQFI